MLAVYIRERSFHTPQSLSKLLSLNADETQHLVERLCSCGVLKLRTSNDREEYDADFEGDESGKYQFVYVGVVLVDDIILVLYPKYLPVIDALKPDECTKTAMRQVFRVLRKSNGGYSHIAITAEDGMTADGKLVLMLALLEMYSEYGVYSNYVRTIADNGSGEINWERTISSNLPFVHNGTPIYMDYKTVETDQDSSDFVTRLHRCVLTECSRFLQETGIADLLSIDEVWLSDANVDDFGDVDFISYRLERERGTQFVTWKQQVIDLLLEYVGEDNTAARPETPLCLGTSSFYHVWEVACKVAFEDSLEKRLGDLGFELSEKWAKRRNDTLLKIIPRPQWSETSDSDESPCGDVATLIPDTVLITRNSKKDRVFAIIDAKYYTPKLGEKVQGVPGVESVTKQFLYQAAYRDFVLDNGFDYVANAFIAPSSDNEIVHRGRVRFPGVMPIEEPPFSNSVELYEVPAGLVFDAYIAGTSLDGINLWTVTG